jgi:hypothetical protein
MGLGWAGFLGGALLGALPGVTLGLIGGLVAGGLATRRRRERRPIPPDDPVTPADTAAGEPLSSAVTVLDGRNAPRLPSGESRTGSEAHPEESPADVPDIRREQLTPASTGQCKACRYEPVAFDAQACPHCGVRNPNPGILNRYAAKGGVIAVVVAVPLGAGIGYFACADKLGLGGAFLGAAGGLISAAVPGLVVGVLCGIVARLCGKR